MRRPSNAEVPIAIEAPAAAVEQRIADHCDFAVERRVGKRLNGAHERSDDHCSSDNGDAVFQQSQRRDET